MMASSMLSSERRWTSTRKSGMTVLGKVPKPINLPSQKLENHGLDPNVEIVPKGALTWGSRPSLASSNAWGSPTLSSPRADGSTGSSVHANGRPLSGGSGTRPSTGSSERSSEPSAISWGPSSRPSSASGTVPTSHVLLAGSRPRSAETRPNSSQLSRFAESSADAISWGPAGTSEKVAAEASKRSDFTLSSGDFPTLGSEKIDEPKLLQGQSPKSRSPESGLPSSLKGIPESQLNSAYGNLSPMVHGNFNSWSADSSSYAGEGSSTRPDKWHNDNHNSQPLLDANMPARQVAPWHGHPGHSPNVVWYGGHDAGGPYRPFGPRGGYHDPYYPYVPAGALPNAQTFSRPDAIPGGVHFNNREAYRHMPPESYIAHGQPGIPVRPGVYPGPVLYEGFHAPPHTGFNNSSEQDVSAMGMPAQFAFHNQHMPDNSRIQPWRFHTQADGSAPVMTQQQMISGQANETLGHYKVLLKQHGNQEGQHAATVWPTTQRGKLPGFSTPEENLVNSVKLDQTTDKQHVDDSLSEHSNDLVEHSSINSLGISKSTLDTESVPIRDQHNANLKKNAILMEKVEGLNSKTRAIDVHVDGENFPSKEKMRSKQSSKNNPARFEDIGPTNFSSASSTLISGPRNADTSELKIFTQGIIHESVTELKPSPHQSDELAVVPDKSNYSENVGHSKSRNQKKIRNMKAGVDHHYGKLKFGSYGAEEMNDTPERDSLEKTSTAAGKSGYSLSILGSHASQGVSEVQDSQLIFKSASEQSSKESVEDDVQRAKQKELARQRAVELQKKELERTTEQKAKAQAKLDELNRRTLASSKQNPRRSPPPNNDTRSKHDTTGNDAKSSDVANEGENAGNYETTGLAVSSFAEPSGTLGSSVQARPSIDEQSWPLGQATTPAVNTGRTTSDLQDEVEVVSRRKQPGYRRRRNITDEHNQSERKTSSDGSGNTRSAYIVIEGSSDGLGTVNIEDSTFHSSSNNNRGSRYKAKSCNSHISSSLPSSAHLEVSEKNVVDSNETKLQAVEQMPEKILDENIGGQDSFIVKDAPSQERSEPCKITSDRATNNWKPHPHRKPSRNLQSDKANAKYQTSDAVVWAPVKPVNKNGSSEQVHKNSASQVTILPDGKNEQDVNNGVKAKRAEMERYVPKPIAKEQSLQGDSQHSSPPFVPASFAAMTGKPDSASVSPLIGRDVNSSVAKTAISSTNTEDTKQNKQGKTRASWRQRNSFEPERSAMEGNPSFESSRCVEKASELQDSRSSDDLHVEGSNRVPEESTMTTLSIVKNHGVNRQRRQQFKEYRVDRSSYAPTHGKVMQGDVSDKREMPESGERNHSRNENQSSGSGQLRSQWQPKSQVQPQNYLLKNYGGQRAADEQTIEKGLDVCVDQGKKTEIVDTMHQEYYSGRKVMADDWRHQEDSKERKAMKQPPKDENECMGRDCSSITETASADANNYPEYPAVHRRGYNRYRGSQKVHSTGDRRNVQQNVEYQIGWQNTGASEEVAESHRISSGERYGGQGRHQSRRGGHSYGPRRGPTVRASSSYDIGG